MNSGLQRGSTIERQDFVERAVRGTFGAGAVVADDVVDERVVEDPEVSERIDQPAEMVVGVLQESGVDLHLASEYRLQSLVHVFPR
jgi:hypothetical protein